MSASAAPAAARGHEHVRGTGRLLPLKLILYLARPATRRPITAVHHATAPLPPLPRSPPGSHQGQVLRGSGSGWRLARRRRPFCPSHAAACACRLGQLCRVCAEQVACGVGHTVGRA